MIFEASAYACQLGLPKQTDSQKTRGPLTMAESSLLQQKLANDSQKLIYSSILSIADAVRGLEANYVTWPTVKLYYSAFYSVKALLALSSVCLYHIGTKPFWIDCLPGQFAASVPAEARGSSHKIAFAVFKRQFPSSPLLAQTIDGISSFDWLMARREEANYKVPRFVEPSSNNLFRFLEKQDVRKLCVLYSNDDLFAFDPDHAMLSFPIYLLKQINKLGVRGNSCLVDHTESVEYERYLQDRFGPLQTLVDLKKTMIL